MEEIIRMPPGAVMGAEMILPNSGIGASTRGSSKRKRFTPQAAGLTEIHHSILPCSRTREM